MQQQAMQNSDYWVGGRGWGRRWLLRRLKEKTYMGSPQSLMTAYEYVIWKVKLKTLCFFEFLPTKKNVPV